MGKAIVFVEEPVSYRMVGGVVHVEVVTGGEVKQFAMSANHFLAGFARAAVVARQWRGGACEVVPIKRAAG